MTIYKFEEEGEIVEIEYKSIISNWYRPFDEMPSDIAIKGDCILITQIQNNVVRSSFSNVTYQEIDKFVQDAHNKHGEFYEVQIHNLTPHPETNNVAVYKIKTIISSYTGMF